MLKRKLIWQVYASFLTVTLISLLAVTWYFSGAFRNFYYRQTRSELLNLADFAAEQVSVMFDTSQTDRLDELCKNLGKASEGRIRVTVILSSGKVVADSDKDVSRIENHSNRPEIIDAEEKGFGWKLRPSPTLGIRMMYVAVPIKRQKEVLAVVRTSIAATAIDQALVKMYIKIFCGGLAIALCAAVLSYVISRRISGPVVSMEQIAQRFAKGQLDLRVPIPSPAELAALANALNEMARQLYDKITTVTSQRNELETVLSSMIEGVAAVDHEGRIISMNRAAANLLNVDPTQIKGRNIEEVVREVDIQKFVRRMLEGEKPIEAEVSIQIEGERFLQLHGASLPKTTDGKTGAVIVLHDITLMRRFENVRRDFVANVN